MRGAPPLALPEGIHELVVDDDRITRRIGAVLHGEARPQVTDGQRTHHQVALLVVDGEGQVDHLDVVVGSDIADGIGGVDAEAEVDALLAKKK